MASGQSIDVPIGCRIRGRWRLRLAARLLRGFGVDTKVGSASWKALPIKMVVTITALSAEGSQG